MSLLVTKCNYEVQTSPFILRGVFRGSLEAEGLTGCLRSSLKCSTRNSTHARIIEHGTASCQSTNGTGRFPGAHPEVCECSEFDTARTLSKIPRVKNPLEVVDGIGTCRNRL